MNGAECGRCGEISCVCEKIKEDKKRKRAVELALDKSANSVFKLLIKPKGIRLRLLRWLFPELKDLANKLRQFYWTEEI